MVFPSNKHAFGFCCIVNYLRQTPKEMAGGKAEGLDLLPARGPPSTGAAYIEQLKNKPVWAPRRP